MNAPAPPPRHSADWQVPAHTIALHGARRWPHALVIPVINEGERIRAQLQRIKAADLPVDVIIADGGSSDGSLDPDFLRRQGVRAVLTKTGPGRLSAQLRMAYAWCLGEGYAGIVTIDGNGKDGIEAIATMVARLEEGYDYVQGSRYLPGGLAENTPLERTLANRLVHAPLLSLAGRRWLSDTTNGFRAYSARYLTHPQVQPFRAVFSDYSLLFYLTVRAGQLALKVCEVPVARRYPRSGKVPTKIGGLGAKIALLKEALIAASGGYTPDSPAPARSGWRAPILVTLLVLAPLLISLIAHPPYSPDSWALYELAQSIFADFYRFTHWRSYASSAPHSAAFPPLTPVLIALGDAAFGSGARTGLYLAFAAFAGFALTSEAIGRRVTGAPWLGLAAAGVLLVGPNMIIAELGAGRTIPLQLLLYALIVLGLLRGAGRSLKGALGLGLLAGLAALNRFDGAPAALLVAGAVLWQSRRAGLALAALAAGLAALSPWIAYSLTTFGTPFASDNAAAARALDPRAYVTDWWPVPPPSLADDPLSWAERAAGNLIGLVRLGAGLAASPLGLGAVALIAAPLALAWLGTGPQRADAGKDARKGLMVLAATCAALALLLAPQVATGYSEPRYLSALAWALLLTIACWGVAQGLTAHQRALVARLAASMAGVAVVVVLAARIGAAGVPDWRAWPRFAAPVEVRVLEACLAETPGARVLVLGDDNLAARAGALGGLATMMEPRNMADGRLGPAGSRAFLDAFAVDYVLIADPARRAFALATLPLRREETCPLALYRVERAR
ncbi:MAG: glycosyltransferase family 2 protein [Erythrobacter cryptus]